MSEHARELPPLEPEPEQKPDKAPAERRQSAATKRSSKVVDGLTKQFGMLGMFVYMGNQYDGEVLIGQAPAMAESLEQIGRKNKTFYRVLVLLAEESEWTALFMAFGGTTVAIGANHGLFPVNWTRAFSIRPPERGERGEREEQRTPEQIPVHENAGPMYTGGPSTGEPPEGINDNAGTGAPAGLHINAEQMNLIREQAERAALAQYQQAQQQGIIA